MPADAPVDLAAWPADRLTETLAEAARLTSQTRDPLAAATAFRAAFPALTPDEAAAVLQQSALREAARSRYGLDPGPALLTRDGLEQATRPEVAAYRAGLLAASGARRVLDLTAGLGFDSAAFCAAGLAVTAVERDARIAALCQHNVPDATVVTADVTDHDVLTDLLAELAPNDVVFVDPARRDPAAARDLSSGRARPERDPERWSPPLSFITSVPHPRVAIKASPAFQPPPGWHAAWSSVDRVVVECAAYSWPALGTSRQAVVHGPAGPLTLDADDHHVPLARATSVGPWLLEPDPAIERAGAWAALADRLRADVMRVDDESTWLTATARPPAEAAGLVRCYRVIDELTGSTVDQRRALRARSIDHLVVKSRDVRIDPARVLRELGCREGRGPVLILTRRDGRMISLLADAVVVPRG